MGGFARFAGEWSGDCRNENFPDTCYFRYIARASDGLYIAGLQNGNFFKMVKFDSHGTNQPGTGKYYVGSPPADAEAMVAAYATANSAGSNYVFVKLDDFSCDAAATAAPTPGSASDCNTWMVPPGFARVAGEWSGDCRNENFPDACYFRYIARASDGLYIAGLQDGNFFKMVKFASHGTNQPGTGKYYVGSPPADAEAMVAAYATANSA